MEDPPLDRKLLAILAADMVGYSKAMEADEAGTIARLKDHPRRVDRSRHRPAPWPHRQADGRWRAGRLR